MYTAKLLADAGADYLWADSGEVASSPVDFETVFEEIRGERRLLD